MSTKTNGYELSRDWFNFSFECIDAKVHHTALFMWIVELNNRLGWKSEFGLSTYSTMEGLSIGNKNTYLNTLKDLNDWGFIEIITPSKNQYQSTIIKICRNKKATAKVTALDTALSQQSNGTDNSIDTSIDPIYKQETIKPKTIKQINEPIPSIEDFVSYALENKPNIDTESVKLKYNSWKVNGWKTSGKNAKPIKNWKSTLLNTLPYIKETTINQGFSTNR